MGRRAVEVEVVLFHVLAVITLAVDQAEQALLENRVFSIPQGEREAKSLLVIRNSRQTVLPPAISARAGLIMAEVVPRIAPLAVVLAHCSPLPLTEVGPPFAPRSVLLAGFLQSVSFG